MTGDQRHWRESPCVGTLTPLVDLLCVLIPTNDILIVVRSRSRYRLWAVTKLCLVSVASVGWLPHTAYAYLSLDFCAPGLSVRCRWSGATFTRLPDYFVLQYSKGGRTPVTTL